MISKLQIKLLTPKHGFNHSVFVGDKKGTINILTLDQLKFTFEVP